MVVDAKALREMPVKKPRKTYLLATSKQVYGPHHGRVRNTSERHANMKANLETVHELANVVKLCVPAWCNGHEGGSSHSQGDKSKSMAVQYKTGPKLQSSGKTRPSSHSSVKPWKAVGMSSSAS